MVKKNDRPAHYALLCRALAIASIALTACASPSGGWQQLAKNEALTQADYAACRRQAEESTLELSQSGRPGYGILNERGTGPFNPRGDDPMAIADKSGTSALFNALIANCMTQKGYHQPRDE